MEIKRKNAKILEISKSVNDITRDVLRTYWNIYDKTFFMKIVNGFFAKELHDNIQLGSKYSSDIPKLYEGFTF